MSFTFQTVDVKSELVASLRAALISFGYTGDNNVRVIKADPQSPSEIPCIGLNRTDDSESSQSIADSEGTLYNKDTQELDTFYGTFFSESIEIRIWHTNADERDKLYLAVRATLFATRTDLVSKGLLNLTLRGGRDEQDSTMSQAPMVLYWSTITMTYLNPLDVHFMSTVAAITAVPGNVTLKSN
jgi:hypothetical protein